MFGVLPYTEASIVSYCPLVQPQTIFFDTGGLRLTDRLEALRHCQLISMKR